MGKKQLVQNHITQGSRIQIMKCVVDNYLVYILYGNLSDLVTPHSIPYYVRSRGGGFTYKFNINVYRRRINSLLKCHQD